MKNSDTPFSYQNISSNSADSGETAETEKSADRTRRRHLVRRAVMKWLTKEDPPTGMATAVSTRTSNYRADIAAFWSKTKTNSRRNHRPSRILTPKRTMIIECRSDWHDCWPDCARSRDLAAELRKWKEKRKELKKEIRDQEPDLRKGDVLFPELSEWRYDKSKNPEYPRIQKKIKNLEKALLKGTKFEKIHRAETSDQHLLAVPTGVIEPEEMADGWGLLWIDNELEVQIVKMPETRECLFENRLHLIQNIAAAAAEKELFAAGIHRPARDNKNTFLVQPPRGHRQAKKFRLDSESAP